MGSTAGLGSGSTGGSKSGNSSRASLHSKAVIIDKRLAVIGSMNLDLRSQLQEQRGGAADPQRRCFAGSAARQVEATIRAGRLPARAATTDQLVWRAPPGAAFQDTRSEPDASTELKLLVKLIGPFAPDEML